MRFRKYIYCLVILIAVGVYFIINNSNFIKKVEFSNVQHIKHIKIGEQILKIDLALTPKAQTTGLSGRSALAEDEGMLFVFNHRAKHAFWMKDMNFPIDIIWINEDLKIIYIKKDVKPESFPESFSPTEDATYVLEVKALFSEQNNLEIGNIVEFLP